MSSKPWTDEDRLRELYGEKGLSQTEIAEELGCSHATVSIWTDKFDIERGVNVDKTPWKDEETLYEAYVEKQKSSVELSSEWGCSKKTILNWLRRFGIPTRRENIDKPVPLQHHKHGYEFWKHQHGGERWAVYLHRLLAVSEYGMNEVSDSVVHHKNGVPWDNRPDNIELLTRSEHARLHALEREDFGENA